MQVLGDQITQELGISLVLLPSYFANAVKTAQSAGISGAPEGHHLIRYDVHGYILRGLARGLGQLLGELAQQALGHGVPADVGVDGEHRHGGGGEGRRVLRRVLLSLLRRRGAAGPAAAQWSGAGRRRRAPFSAWLITKKRILLLIKEVPSNLLRKKLLLFENLQTLNSKLWRRKKPQSLRGPWFPR